MPDVHVIGVVPNRPAAEQVVGNLRLAGFPQEAVSIIMVTKEDPAALENVDDQTGEGVEDVAKHAAVGAGIGGATGAAIGAATLLIPGVGPIVGAGAIASLLIGGTAVGGLMGAFTSQDESTQVIDRYGMALREGQALVTVKADTTDQARQVEQMLTDYGATNVNSYFEDITNVTDAQGVKDVSQ